jgi:geranylgeranyl reductase family protein
MNRKYDVIIVGSGPAGGTAAFYLGEAGKRVLVIEKESLPRYKTCGGAVSTRMLEQFPFSFETVIQSKVKAISYGLREATVTIPLPDRSLSMVMRAEFDEYLLKHARADVRQGETVRAVDEGIEAVTVETSKGERIQGEYLIAADGANSIVARSLGLRRRKVIAGAIEIEAAVPAEIFDRFADRPLLIFGEIGVGYLWVFPKLDHLSVGIGALHPRPGELQSVLARVMNRYGIPISGQLQKGHPLPIYTRGEQISTARSLLTGDAAGLVDPFTGEGIRFAIKSGRMAAESILSGHPERYPYLVRRHIDNNHRQALGLTSVFYRFPRLFFELGLRNPALSHALLDLLADQIDYGEVLLQTFATLPVFLGNEMASAWRRVERVDSLT